VVERVLGERVLTDVPVTLRGEDAALWRATPATIELTVRGPQDQVTRLVPGEDAVWVDVSDLQRGKAAEREPEFELPPGVEVLRWRPRRIRVAPLPPATDTQSGAPSPAPARGARAGGTR
jgi:hypothetical protein